MRGSASVARELEEARGCLRCHLPGVDRVAVALYDGRTDTLRTFAHSTEGPTPLQRYEVRLAEVPSLQVLTDAHETRVLDELAPPGPGAAEHTRRVWEAGYRSSFTQPFYEGDRLLGVLFLDSRQPACFRAASTEWLSAFGHLVGLALAHRLLPARLLESALRVAARLTHYRDPETRSHLDRMAHYAQLIGRDLAPVEDLTDEHLEFLLLFAPMHDVGKIAIPDSILLKQGALTAGELAVMRTHVMRGAEIVEGILADTDPHAVAGTGLAHVSMLRNVVLHHHERMDGHGYPAGLVGASIPLEARIVTVADVFDALTSRRPYKEAWSAEDAFAYLEEGAGTRFDPRCVDALRRNAGHAARIRAQFPDAPGAVQSREGYTAEL